MSFTLHLITLTRKQLYLHLRQAYANGALKLVKRIHTLFAMTEEMGVRDVAKMLALGEQTVRDWRNQFLLKDVGHAVTAAKPCSSFSVRMARFDH